MIKKRLLVLIAVMTFALTLFACGGNGKTYKFELDKTEITMTVGGTDLLTLNTDYENPDLSWSSSDTTIAEVNGFGGITAKKSGAATITVSANIGKKEYSADCRVTVVSKYSETFEESVIYPNDTLDVSLTGGGSIANFAYTVVVIKNGTIIENAVKDNIFSVIEAGEYTLTYTVNGDGLTESTVTRVIKVAEPKEYGLISGFETTSSVYKQAASSYEITDAPVGNPEGSEKALRLEYSATEQHLRFTVPFNLLSVENMNDGGYFELTYFVHHPGITVPYKHYGHVDVMRSAEDSSNGSIVKRYTGSMFTVNEWAHQRLYVRDIKDFAGENVELYVRYHFGNDKLASGYIDYVYITGFRYCYGDATIESGNDFDTAIPMLMDYDFTVTNTSEVTVATGNATAHTIGKDDLPVGEYKLKYTSKDNSVAQKTLERKLIVLSKNEFEVSADNVMAFYQGANGLRPLADVENVTLASEELPDGATEGAKAVKLSGDTEKLNTENGLAANTLKVQAKFGGIRLDKIVADEENLGKYLEFTVRYNSDKVTDGTAINWQYFYILDGADCFASFENLSNFVQLKANQWVNVRIPVLQIKEMVDRITAAKTGTNAVCALYPAMQIYNRDKADNYSVYFYGARLADGADFGDVTLADASLYRNERLDVTMTRNEKGFGYTLKAEKDGADVTADVITEKENGKFFMANAGGEYTLTYVMRAYGFNQKTVTRKIVVSQNMSYFREFEDATLYIGQTLDLGISEPDISNFRYTVKAILEGTEEDVISDDVFAPTKAGAYVIEYKVNGDGYVEATLTRNVLVKETRSVGDIYDFDTVGAIAAWGVADSGKTTDLPDGVPGDKKSALKLVTPATAANMQHTLVYSWADKTAYNLMNGIDKLDDNDYYVLRYYLKSDVTTQSRRFAFIDLIGDVSKAGGNDALVIRWSDVALEINKWAELKIRVGDFRSAALTKNANTLYLRIHYNKTTTAPVISEAYYYDFTLERGEKQVAPNTGFSVELFDTEGKLTAYTYKIYDSENTVVKSGDNTSVVISDGLAAGKYTVVYEHNDASAKKNITRTINVATKESLISEITDDYVQAITRPDKTPVDLGWEIVTDTTLLPQTGLPGITKAIKIIGDKTVAKGNYPIVFKYTVDISDILTDSAYEGKSLRFYACQSSETETSAVGSNWNELYLDTGLKDHLGGKGHVATKTSGYGGIKAKDVADLIPNQWVEFRLSVATIKSWFVDSTANYSSFNIGMMVHTINTADFDVYVSALEIVD